MKIFGLANHREVPKNATAQGKTVRLTFRWEYDKEGNKTLVQDEEIDSEAEIQSFLEETKIENIIRRATFDPTILQSLNTRLGDGDVVDYSDAPSTLMDMQNLMIQAERVFEKLPKEQRALFDNDKDKFIASYGTEAWANAFGLTTKKPVVDEAPAGEAKTE